MPLPDQPKDTPIPPHLDRWNWGAFLLNWIWGLGNSTYIALLMFVPLVNIGLLFALGAKGSKWAWKNRTWASEAEFARVQRNWARGGFILLAVIVLFLVLIFSLMKNSEAYRLSMARAENDPRVLAALGTPLNAGLIVSGRIDISGSSGSAALKIPVSGPKCRGELISLAEKRDGNWTLTLLVLQSRCSATPVVLVNTNNIPISGAVRSESI